MTSGKGTWGYLVAFLLVAGAVAIRLPLDGFFGASVPFLLFFPAMLAASWYGGLGPGLLGTIVSGLAAMYFFLPPDGFAIGGAVDVVSLALFTTIGVAIAALNHRLRSEEASRRLEAELARTRAERLDAIINTTVDGIIVIDSKGALESFNHGAERLFGYSESEVKGRNVSMLMPSPYHEEHDTYLRRYLSTGKAAIIGTGREVQGRRRDGTVFPLHLSVGEMSIGGERKFTGMLHDLSQRVRLEEQLRGSEGRWRAIIDSAVDGIVVIDSHGRVEAFNPAAERLFGYTETEVTGQNVSMLMPSPYREQHDFYLTRYLATGKAKIIGSGREVTGLRKDGTTFPLHLSVGEITIGGGRRFTGIIHDLTNRVRLEEQLREGAALARLGEMVAVIAHEVKNPLAGIRGAIQVIGSRLPSSNQDAPMIKEIVQRIDSLDTMMKDLLLFARPPKPRRAPTEISRLVATTASLLQEGELLRGVSVNVQGSSPPVPADAEMLTMVFQNLLLNGADAMQGRGDIEVSVEAAEGWCRVSFKDSGPGIPADIREKIFTPFFTTKRKGTGLGLPTVKRFVEAHDGELTLDCPPEGGTRITVRLPLSEPVADPALAALR